MPRLDTRLVRSIQAHLFFFLRAALVFLLYLGTSGLRSPSSVMAQSANLGDFDNDGQVSGADLNLLSSKMKTSFCAYNLTGDCTIDLYDYNVLYGKLGTTYIKHLPESTIVSCNPSEPKPARSINIGAQNLGQDEANPLRATQLVPEILKKYDLDIMTFTEFYAYGSTSGPKALEIVMRQLYPGVTTYHAYQDSWMNVAIFSKFPIIDQAIYPIFDRHIIHAKIRTPYGDIRVFSWHAKRDMGGNAKNACAYNRAAYDYMRTVIQPGEKIVFTGDFNDSKEQIFGECGGNPTELFLPNCNATNSQTCYQYSDFFVGVNGPQVYNLCSQGNFYNLVDGHILTTGTVIIN